MTPKRPRRTAAQFFKEEKWGLLLLLVLGLVIALLRVRLAGPAEPAPESGSFVEYEKGLVAEVYSDTTEEDARVEGALRGEQMLSVEVLTGRYKGTFLLANNYIGPLYGVALQEDDEVALMISTYDSGEVRADVHEYNRVPALIWVLVLFLLITLAVGGRTGAKSLVALALTVFCLFYLLIPMLLRGAPTLPSVFAICALIAALSFTLLGGLHRKSVCALLGTLAGTALALVFGLLAQKLARVDGLRIPQVEMLLNLRQSGTPIGLRGLLVGGLVISALGAVMDVAMSISSALEEIHIANPAYRARELFRSGMNIGRDMVGTMTNTLILAFIGSSFMLTIYLYSLGLSFYNLAPSAYVAVELISGVASSAGMILAIPLTALVSALLLGRDPVPAPAEPRKQPRGNAKRTS
ncbi:MAG: YibE/F family protein [Oscillospiraceae bacterium]|nr:YibE/F family protein [Oscillospiraceae bacterium]